MIPQPFVPVLAIFYTCRVSNDFATMEVQWNSTCTRCHAQQACPVSPVFFKFATTGPSLGGVRWFLEPAQLLLHAPPSPVTLYANHSALQTHALIVDCCDGAASSCHCKRAEFVGTATETRLVAKPSLVRRLLGPVSVGCDGRTPCTYSYWY